MAGVSPNPPAEFSALAITRSTLLVSTTWPRWSRTILRPGLPNMSPMNNICMSFESLIVTLPPRELSVERELLGEMHGSKKIVVARGINMQIPHSGGVDNHVVEVPQVNVRQIARQDLLYLGINLLPLLLVYGA